MNAIIAYVVGLLVLLQRSWKRNWPLMAGAIGLLLVFLYSAAAVIQSALVFGSGEVTHFDLVMFALSVNTATLVTLTLNLAIRIARVEEDTAANGIVTKQLSTDVETLNSSMDAKLDSLQLSIDGMAKNSVPGNRFLLDDNATLWASTYLSFRAIFPRLRSEVSVISTGPGVVQYEINQERLQIFKQRATQGYIEIIFPMGQMMKDDDAVWFHKKTYDLELIVKATVFLKALRDTGSVDMSKVKIYFAKRGISELKSEFLTHIVGPSGKVQPAYLMYSNANTEDDIGTGLVAAFFGPGRLAKGEGRWRELKDNAYRWNIDQLVKCFDKYLPKMEGDDCQRIHDDFSFDPASALDFNPRTDRDFVDGDHMRIDNSQPTKATQEELVLDDNDEDVQVKTISVN